MHKNQLDKIRILAALVVIFSHHFPLTGTQAPAWLETSRLHWSFAGGVGVMVFFCISGYLVTLSWYREPQFTSFLWKRILRLWPGMLGSVVCGVFLFGLLFNSLPLANYLENPRTWQFFWTNLTLLKQFNLVPGSFPGNPVPEVMNGVYWTIPMEFLCYLVLGGLGLAGILGRPALIKGLLLLYIAVFLFFFNMDITGDIRHWVEYPAYFAAGALIALHKEWFSKYGGRVLLVAAPVLIATYFFTPYPHTSRFFLLPTLVIFLGSLPAKSTWFTRLGDPSYGIYLYGFPIAQSVVSLWPDLNFWASLLLTLALSICAGYASWLLLESRALRWKNFRFDAPARQKLARLIFEWFWPLLACFIGLRFIARNLDYPLTFDALHHYLPAARTLLDQGWTFLLRPESYYYAPLAYIWPALLGAEPTLIRIANMGLWTGCVWFMWRTCQMLGGKRTAALAMLLLLSPELVRYFPSELTEPIYLFGLLGWMHAMARIIVGQERTWGVVAQGACMLTLTLLSRPVLQLIAPAALLICVGCIGYWAIAGRGIRRPAWLQRLPTAALSLAFGLLIPLAVIIKNGTLFGLWGIGTGSGIGLYLGTHPLIQGTEPSFLGFDFDVDWVAAAANLPGGLRSAASETALRQVAMWQIQSMPLVDAVAFFGHKLWWWLAHHPAQIDTYGSALRKVRFFELSTIVVASIWLVWNWLRHRNVPSSSRGEIAPRQWALAALLLLIFLGMLAQMLPILYNARYSAALLDPWLIPLAALGLSLLTNSIQLQGTFTKHRWSVGMAVREGMSLASSVVAIVTILILTFGGYDLARKAEHVAVDPDHMGHTVAHLTIANSNSIETRGMERQSERTWITTQSPAVFMIRVSSDDIGRATAANILNAMWETEVALKTKSHRCQKVETAYQTSDGRMLQPAYKLPVNLSPRANGEPERLVTHANHELRPLEPGYLRLILHCPLETRLEWFRTSLLESRHAWDAAKHAQQPVHP